MDFTERINADIKAAMLAKEKEKLNALRAIKSALLLEATKGGDGTIDEATAIKILQKLHKQRMEAADIYRAQQREDLLQEEMVQADVIASYLPKAMSAEELTEAIKTIVQQVGATGPQDLGKVMGVASKELAGKADGKSISETVKKILNG
ncbi:MAG TPA: GatB/YqeY domain-containing protein [Luteibaculaceae bacterium]|nr:GatB/YqeY domain-containing protein [Luteibaculaceae bacterium]